MMEQQNRSGLGLIEEAEAGRSVGSGGWSGRERAIVLLLFLALLAGGTGGTTGCGPPLPPSKPLSELNAQEASGYGIYRVACASCHYANSAGTLRGPGMQALYKRPYLPSGAPANDDRVRAAILGGRNTMPGFQNKLDEQQLQDLIAYLHTL